LFVLAAACFDRQHRGAILSGGFIAGALMYWQYDHARRAGLAAAGLPGTED
jgi:hypothetical protein